MSRIVYVNGEYLPEEDAKISIFDRGFLMADGVYEVTSVIDGKLIDYAGHEVRLKRSLGELRMDHACSDEELLAAHRGLMEKNNLDNGMIYLQITRGNAGDRDFVWAEGAPSTIVMFTQAKDLVNSPAAKTGLKVISIHDERWGRRDIKTTQLLYPSFCKMEAKAAGKDDAWLTDDEGLVNEGTSNNAYIIKDGVIITRHLSNDILHGITRAAVLRFAKEAQMKVEERAFTVAEAQAADEAFVTAASTFVTAVVEIDGVTLGEGVPGPVANRLREIYIEESKAAGV